MATLSSPLSTSLPRAPRLSKRWWWLAAFLVAVGWSVWQTGAFRREVINPRGWRLVERFLAAALRPDLSGEFLAVVVEATLQTLTYAVLGIAVSLALGAAGGLFASEVWWLSILPGRGGKPPRLARLAWGTVRAALAVPRAVHEILWGLFFLNIFGLNPMTVILAIGLHFGAVTAKVVSEILDETPRDAYHALRNAGAGALAAFFYALIPQAAPNLVAYGFYRFECAIRASAILGVVGAGGLGYQLYLSLDSLAYRQVWTLFYAMVFLSGLTDLWSSLIRGQLNSAARTSLCVDVACGNPNTSNVTPRPIAAPTWVSRYSLPLFGVLMIFSLLYVRPDVGIFFSERTQKLWAQIVSDLFPPRLDLAVFLNAAAQTVAMSILALVIASVIGIVMAFPAAQNFALPEPNGAKRRTWQGQVRRALGLATLVTSRTLLLFMRAIPAPVWALILLFVLFPGILPGAVALGIYAGGILGRLMAETAENLDDRPQRALRASGASGPATFLYAVMPSASPQFLSYILYRWEVCIRETIIVGLVGAGGVGRLLNDQLVAFDFRSIMGTLAGIIVMTFVVDLCSSVIRRQLR